MGQRSRKRGRRTPTGRTAAGRTPAGRTPPSAERPAPRATPTTPAPRADGTTPDSIGGWRVEPELSRSERRNAEVRAGLTPLNAGERPGAIIAGTVVAALLGLGNLIAYAAGVKIGGKHPAAGGIVVFSALMLVCAAGMWRLWYGAVLGFMALLAIVATLFALLLIEASNVLGVVVGLLVIGGSGYLFFKLVRVLSRIQMPRYPGR